MLERFRHADKSERHRERIAAGAPLVKIREIQYAIGGDNAIRATAPRAADVDRSALDRFVIDGRGSASHRIDKSVIETPITTIALGESAGFGFSGHRIDALPGPRGIGLPIVFLSGRTILRRLYRFVVELRKTLPQLGLFLGSQNPAGVGIRESGFEQAVIDFSLSGRRVGPIFRIRNHDPVDKLRLWRSLEVSNGIAKPEQTKGRFDELILTGGPVGLGVFGAGQ